jgi:hypothetical protein
MALCYAPGAAGSASIHTCVKGQSVITWNAAVADKAPDNDAATGSATVNR